MAGVSMTAVSFVLNNKPGVSDETREHIQKIIDETGFKPNLNSKKLLFNKSFNICVMISPDASPFEDLFYFEVTRGILNKSREHGYNISINEPNYEDNELPDVVYTGDTDGIIFMQDISDALTEKAISSGVPFVVVDSHSLSDKVTSINPNYHGAAYSATSYLLSLGHRNIAMISSNVVPRFHEQTRSGFLSAMQEYGLKPAKEALAQSVRTETEAYDAVPQRCCVRSIPLRSVPCTARRIWACGSRRMCPSLVSMMSCWHATPTPSSRPSASTRSIWASLPWICCCKRLKAALQRAAAFPWI